MKTGIDLLHDPALNKGSAFTSAERVRLGLLGLVPPHSSTIQEQVLRVLGNVRGQCSDLAKYVEMIGLLDRNETLFYRVVMDYIEEMMPLIYTPTVGKACQVYGHIFRRSRGLFITKRERGMIREVLGHWPQKDVRVIVVTDGSRILGLGDLGGNGMGIPVGKLSLYTACGGIPPSQTLPVMLDLGTDSEELLKDPLYLGVHERRLTGALYDELLDEFISGVQEVFPKAMIQFEDFSNHNAFHLLQKYRDRICAFNDDIQGTAAVALAGLYSTAKITGRRLRDETLLFCGAGEAATGIADIVVGAMTAAGASKAQALSRCWFMDTKGLVESGRKNLQAHKKPYAHKHAPIHDLAAAVKKLKPTALIGASGKARQFTKAIIEEMARINERPVIFALSNPTDNSECTAEQAYRWSRGKALFASGSPFGPVTLRGRIFVPGQANNVYIFPGVGMGVIASGASRVTDEMFHEAARALARCVTQDDLSLGRLFPPLSMIRTISVEIATAVARTAYARELATEPIPDDLNAHIQAIQYQPVYKDYL